MTRSSKKNLHSPMTPLFWEIQSPEKERASSVRKPVAPDRRSAVSNGLDSPLNPETVYRQAWLEVAGRVPRSVRQVEVVYYPYTGLQAKAVIQDGVLRVRIADLIEDMPQEVFVALSRILVGRLEKKAYPRHYDRIFDEYADRPEVQDRVQKKKQNRTIRTYGTGGKRYDLEEVFDRVNRDYFQGRMARPILSWTKTNSRRRLGYAGDNPDRIFISRVLDRVNVPRYMIEFIMYHEMLHLVCLSEKSGGRTLHHTKKFRLLERQFRHYAKARKWMGYPDGNDLRE